jgi:WD40 repeat protein
MQIDIENIFNNCHLGQKSSLSSTKSFTSVSVSNISGNLLTSSVDSLVRLWDPRSTGKTHFFPPLNIPQFHRRLYGKADICRSHRLDIARMLESEQCQLVHIEQFRQVSQNVGRAQ